MKWEITDVDALGRLGRLTVNNKEFITPNLFPVLHPYRNIINLSDLKKIGAQCVFTNAYIIYQNPEIRDTVLRKGIHKYLNFNGIIATDSGAFQKYMYNKSDFELNPEDIEKFQEDIGSDFPVILDEPVQPDDDYETARKKVKLSLQRAKDNINRRTNNKCHWFGPIHGAKYKDLLKLSSEEMSKLNFDIYAIGGLVKPFLSYRFDSVIKTLLSVKKNIIWNKPIHMFGLGLPQFFSLAIACGCDLMDSAAYILFAKENRYFTLSTGTRKLEELEEFPCHCPICCEYEPKEVRNFDDKLRTEILAKHNLFISFSELRTIRQAIKEGNLWELVEQRVRNHPSLVNCLGIIKSNFEIFENHEKVYKSHGRLFSSPESTNRILLQRFDLKIESNYRVPPKAIFLIILPELDVKGNQSPSIKSWLEDIETNTIIPREFLHVAYVSDFFGIIPLDLSFTFPMGQFESINNLDTLNTIDQNLSQRIGNYFKFHGKHYDKCGILIPDKYINHFNEETKYSKKKKILSIFDKLGTILPTKFSYFKDLSGMWQFFKGDSK
ncbi:MAG: tRNA guanosine(15) transglycosylase TgtA [Candidatus Hodarchaeales archaeon]